ncbi:tyrosine-protein phosphatase non-receptor type 23 isoform X1 [Hylaeus anthracinus]|uniref:tyrosine-protein phosphatase non-receptor type 23 isoform X1 n=1 Tax=Hylaeus anthracinus TaxID=313031 RepID=UPI0023B9C1A7|nr:tyrosine-protein phosphatase non-receptor type 23 isoform X1 [Hylaeus anthracinus]
MEAVPRLPMIYFQLKVSPEITSFRSKLKQYIRDFYNEDAESYSNEIYQLESLRAMAVRPPIDMAGCLLLKKYYCQLHFLQSRFPMGKDGTAAVTFTWRDTYANMVCSLANIRFEIISILYNIGSMHTQLGARTERTSADGMKIACAHFQCAAWAFEHLKNSYPQPSGVDLAPELMTFMHQLCLAQAQECILEKSMLDNRKPTIVAKVARQIVDYFTLALTTLEQGGSEDGTISDTVGTKIYKSWKRYVKFKKAYHLAVTHLYQGLAAEEQRKMGERVAFYNVALASLNEAQLIYANAKGSIGITGAADEKTIVEEALTFTNDVIEGKRKAAKNENEFIYHEEVPEKETLPTVKGASLVKGISFSINDPEVSGPDIFARLVPMKVHEASSLYSEEKAKILRSVGGKVEEKDQQLNTYLASLKLEHMSLWDTDVQTTEWERLPLPDELVERCAALNAKQHVIQDLVDIMEKLSDTSQDVEKILKEIKKLLLDEELKEKQYQDTVGKRPPSIVATDLTREAKKYEEAHNKASESNHALHKAITMHVKNLKLLAQPLAELITHIPSPSAYFSEQNSEKSHSAIELERMHTKELKRILNKVDEMRRQRNELHGKLRDSIAQDDLTRLLVTATSDSGPLDRLFADQLSKHQTVVTLIDQNLSAQDNILAALTDAYAQTANVRKGVEEILKRREHTITSLIASYDAYEDLLAKSSKGLEFYRKLEINISKLLQRVKSTCKVQEEEREHILAQDNKNSQEKVDTLPSSNYDQSRKSGSGLKLKDYLNNRTENVPNQYYNVYKGPGRPLQVDTTTKSYLNDTVDKNTIHSGGISIPDTASAVNPMQQYYPTSYTDYKTNLPYSYDTTTYNENPAVNSALSQNYMQIKNTDTLGTYQQISATGSTTNTTNTGAPYPVNTFVSNEQFSTALDGQHAYPVNTQLQYNHPSNTYETYQPSVDYTGCNVTQQYPPNLKKTSSVKTEVREVSVAQSPIPASASVNKIMEAQSHLYATVDQQGQQYVPESQQKLVSQESLQTVISQHVLPPDSSQMQNYVVPQISHNEVPGSQNYSSRIYYNPSDPHSQQVATTKNMSGTTNSAPCTPYIPTQYINAGIPQSVHSTISLTVPGNEMSTSYSSNLQNNNIVQYPQQNCTEQGQQIYIDKAYSYGSQVPINDTSLSYPSTYQSLQHGAGTSYPQTMLSTEACNTYSYTNCPTNAEMIQSHAKSSATQNYSQAYQYAQQPHYSGYAGYPNPYDQGYNYMQGNQITNMAAEPYNDQMEYTYNSTTQYYEYNSNNLQTTQPVQITQQPTESMTEACTGTNGHQQQESNARYTNASNNSMVSQTPSSQYSDQPYQPQCSSDIYYTTQYGLQMKTQTTTDKTENYTNYNQTYMQAVNNGTNTTTSSNPMKSTSKSSEKSNVDLLSDLDITINHAPLVPEVRPLNKGQTQEVSTAKDATNEDNKEKENEKEQTNVQPTVTEDKVENEHLQIVWDTWYNDVQPKKDPLGDPVVLQKFVSEVEKYEKFVDSLLIKTLSGATNLDIKWKEVQEFEERESGKQSCTVALAHSSENRVTECIPYDTTRVQISSTDVPNYINGSHIMEITQWIPTSFIITQTPLPDKLEVFWMMIWEQESEIIACLATDSQLNGEIYWPINEEDILNIGSFTISLKKRTNHLSYIQRVMSVYNNKKKSEKTVIHMQFLTWPSNGFPSSPGALLTFSTDVMTEQALRRCSKPIVVHCLDGGALSSLFLVAAATVCHIRAGCGIVDVPLVFKGLLKCRKQIVNKESLLFAYQLVLYHAQDILMKRGILSSTRSTFENFEGFKGNKDKTSRKMHPSDDFLQSLGISAQRSDTELGRQKTSTNSSTGHSTSTSIQEKGKEGTIDPLSQLDPLWSIRR